MEPHDLAWLLASYARDGLARVEAAGNAPSLNAVRSALEEALGVNFEGERGTAFFRSTLLQTLFYGIFSAWVLWARQTPAPKGPFDWHDSAQLLRVPVIRVNSAKRERDYMFRTALSFWNGSIGIWTIYQFEVLLWCSIINRRFGFWDQGTYPR